MSLIQAITADEVANREDLPLQETCRITLSDNRPIPASDLTFTTEKVDKKTYNLSLQIYSLNLGWTDGGYLL